MNYKMKGTRIDYGTKKSNSTIKSNIRKPSVYTLIPKVRSITYPRK